MPVSRWVFRTVEKMNRARVIDVGAWVRFWRQAYEELGGRSSEVASKGCPRASAYGLWFLGRLLNGHRAYQVWPISRIDAELGKNAAYAVIGADLLWQGGEMSRADLWAQVQHRYRTETGREPAITEQGEIRVVLSLFREKQLVRGTDQPA